jgi:imidazolonepropionase-like amidohydrolase
MRIFNFAVLMVCVAARLSAQTDLTLIKCGTLIDVKAGTALRDAFILIEGKTIRQVGTDKPLPHDVTLIDLSGMTVLPGLIDAHTHITLHAGNYDNQIIRETPEYRAVCATASAGSTLLAGITTIRDMGNEGSGYADIALRDAINNGTVPGPRIFASIMPVGSTGSYDLIGFSPYITLPPLSYKADGPDEMRTQVRRLIKEGADQVKVYIESFEKKQLHTDIVSGAMNFSDDELKAVVEEAHRSGLKVAAHVYSDEGARQAIDANVNSIEHGLYLTEETFRLMAKREIYYVPTLLVYEYWRDSKIFGQISPAEKIRLTNTVARHTDTFKSALKTPVKIVFGSDTFELPGTNAQELELMVKYGMSPIDALRAGTSVAAELLGIDHIAGTIETGKSADLVAVEGNPLENIENLRHIVFVMKEGKVVVPSNK